MRCRAIGGPWSLGLRLCLRLWLLVVILLHLLLILLWMTPRARRGVARVGVVERLALARVRLEGVPTRHDLGGSEQCRDKGWQLSWVVCSASLRGDNRCCRSCWKGASNRDPGLASGSRRRESGERAVEINRRSDLDCVGLKPPATTG